MSSPKPKLENNMPAIRNGSLGNQFHDNAHFTGVELKKYCAGENIQGRDRLLEQELGNKQGKHRLTVSVNPQNP